MCFHEAPRSQKFQALAARMAAFSLIPLTLHKPTGSFNQYGEAEEFASVFVRSDADSIARGYADLARWHPGYEPSEQEMGRIDRYIRDVGATPVVCAMIAAASRQESDHPSVEFDSMPEPEAMVTFARYGYLSEYGGRPAKSDYDVIDALESINYDRMDDIVAVLAKEKSARATIA